MNEASFCIAGTAAAIISFLFFAPLLDERAPPSPPNYARARRPPEIDLHRMDTQMKGEERNGRRGGRIIL